MTYFAIVSFTVYGYAVYIVAFSGYVFSTVMAIINIVMGPDHTQAVTSTAISLGSLVYLLIPLEGNKFIMLTS